jgi:hypothetical protein
MVELPLHCCQVCTGNGRTIGATDASSATNRTLVVGRTARWIIEMSMPAPDW